MLLSYTLTALAAVLGAAAAADSRGDLGSVLSKQKNLSKFYALIKKYPDVLLQLPSYSGVTIIAPSDKAFDNIPYTALDNIWDPDNKTSTVPLLQYHILKGTVAVDSLDLGTSYVEPTLLTSDLYTNVTSGQNILVNRQSKNIVTITSSQGTRCTVTHSDIPFSGGLIDIVDNLLIPPSQIGPTAQAFQVTEFLGALYAAHLMPKVASQKNITVFAPQDVAFDLVGGHLQTLDGDTLARDMGFHIIPDRVLVSSALQNGSQLTTMAQDAAGQDEQLNITVSGNNKYVGSAQIVQPDILLANGIMHIISNVLNPEAVASPNPSLATQPPAYPVSTASGAFASDLPCTSDCPVTGTPHASVVATTTSTSSHSDMLTSTSDGGAWSARATAHVGAAAFGVLGMGAGLVWL